MSSSLLLSLSSKLSLGKLALQRSSHALGTRMFASTTNPYLLYNVISYGRSGDDINVTTNIHYFDPVNEDEVIVKDRAYPTELRKGCDLVGMSHGWGYFKSRLDNKDKTAYVSGCFNPCGSKSNPKVIPLHVTLKLQGAQAEMVTNVAMTCAPDHQSNHDGYVVAIKCVGPLLSFSRPNGNLENSALELFSTPFHHFDQSRIMYSKRDGKFYMPSLEGNFLGSWDSFFEKENLYGSMLHKLRFYNLPELSHSMWELLDSCSTTVHLVETPSGQRFLIKWYAQNHQPGKAKTFLCGGTKHFMVFREEEEEEEGGERMMCYTEDIGDVCIFLGKSEAFCVDASSFPGLNPNSIYFAGEGFGVYDIATRKPRSFAPKRFSAFSKPPLLPYWIPPMSL